MNDLRSRRSSDLVVSVNHGCQLLFLCKQARPDIEPSLSFLTTGVKEPDEDDWGKLKHGLGYSKGTLYTKRHMKADSLSMIRWWVDA